MTSVLSVQLVSKSFTQVNAVKDLTFAVEQGEVFALLGPNGAGKTSLVRMLVGILRPDHGTIRFHLDGRNLETAPPERLGYLPEERGLFREPPILRTLIYFGILRGMSREAAKASALKWLERFELADRIKDRVDTLSKGNQQKVQLIATLIHNPDIALLDEPFSGLDPLNQELVLEILREFRAQGKTVLLSAHQMDLVERIADRVLLMHRGEEVLRGPLAELGVADDQRQKLLVRFSDRQDLLALTAIPGVERCKPTGGDEIAIWVTEGEPMNRVLHEVAREREIKSVHSERIRLHDLFVQAVGGADMLVAEEEEVANHAE
jgi:ABC-2 type transport system ATP-binding protein